MNLPTLYKKTSIGKIQVWEIKIPSLEDHESPDAILIITTYGLKDGKMQTTFETITSGKNIGKTNETTPYEQAQAEAKSQWEKKKKAKGYVESVEDAEEDKRDALVIGGVDPMLAHSYEKRGHDIRWPAYVQPKLDGHRCIAIIQPDGTCTLWSRTRKLITGVPHIARQLEKLYGKVAVMMGEPMIFDGELYNHAYREKFEELTSFIKQVTPKPGHEVVQYWIYDAVLEGRSFFERKAAIQEAAYQVRDYAEPIVFVPTEEVADEDEMISLFGAYLENGFEGLMVRNAAGMYAGKRSKDLQKVKLMADSEFRITGIKEGKGKMAGHAVFQCETEDGKSFSVKSKGELPLLKSYFLDHNLWKGRDLVVQYQGMTADGVPRFPVGLRLKEDV